MNKRITSLALVFVMVLSLLVTAVPALAAPIESTQLKVTADKTSAKPGDTITFTITLGPVSEMGTMQMDPVIPEGLTYVANSGKLADGLKETLGFDTADWTDATISVYGKNRINGVASAADYSSDKDTVLATFQCTVDDDASGTLKVGLDNLEFYSCQTWEDHTAEYQVIMASVNVTAAPKPATGISLNKSTLELTVGEDETLVATVTPADTTDTVTWDTGRSDIATVDSTGKITAVAPGTAVIAARAGEKSAFCAVTVVAAPCTHTYKTYIGEKPSTCTEQGWDAYSRCDNCGQRFDMDGNEISAIPYLSLAAHKYTANEKKPEALKTAGTCKDKAIYLRSCEVCGKVAPSEAWGTFYGDTDPNNHAGGTTTVNASEPDHKNQVAGNTGDTKCLGCGAIIAHGTAIAPGEHTPASTWNSDGEYHWKTCTVAGCGVVIESSKAAHTPDREAATETEPVKCSVCGYIITPALGHTHDVDTAKFESDETNHWNTCSGCSEKQNISAHEFEWKIDKEATATEKGSKHEECKVCGYKKEAVEIPATGTPTEPTKPEDPDSPQTGDNSMMPLWVALLFVSGAGVAGATLYSRKKKTRNNNKDHAAV